MGWYDSYHAKRGFSPFIVGSSDLHDMLQANSVENLIVAGTATNMCSESTARDAMMLDYKVVMVEDANAARYDDDHLAGLTSFYQSFGDVKTTDATIAMIDWSLMLELLQIFVFSGIGKIPTNAWPVFTDMRD